MRSAAIRIMDEMGQPGEGTKCTPPIQRVPISRQKPQIRLSNLCDIWRVEHRVGRYRADFALAVSAAGELEGGLAAVAGGRVGRDGNLVIAIGQREAEAKRAVWLEGDGLAANREAGGRFRGAVENEFGVEVQPEWFRGLLLAAQRAGYARDRTAGGRGELDRRGGSFSFRSAVAQFRDL